MSNIIPSTAVADIGSTTSNFIGTIAAPSELAIGITLALMLIGVFISFLGSRGYSAAGHMDQSGERFDGDDDLF